MSNWITDRRPTAADANRFSTVLACHNGEVVSVGWEAASDLNLPWMPMPEPYKPLRPDTSLAASIDRVSLWNNEMEVKDYDFGDVLIADDLDRIIEAARKWDTFSMVSVTEPVESKPALAASPGEDRGAEVQGREAQAREQSDDPQDKPKRREWLEDSYCDDLIDPRGYLNFHVREVLPSDPSPEWVDELVRMCETLTECWNSWLPNREVCKEIVNHMNDY